MSFALLPPDHPDDLSTRPRTEGRHAKILLLTQSSRRSTWALKINDPGGYEGRHRRPYGCDPEGWPDGLVFWSPAAQWMRVAGYVDEPVS